MNLTAVIPTYNEARNIGDLTRAMMALPVPGLRVLIVDDNSPDGTGEIADGLTAQYEDRIRVLHRSRRAGLGSAYRAGFHQALSRDADVVIQMDADFSHSPADIPRMLEHIAHSDVVVGSRYVPGGRIDRRWSAGRYFLSWWANSVWVHFFLSLSVRDATSGFKCIRRHVLESIDFDRVRSNGYGFQVEMAYLCERHGFRVTEIPIYFEDRRIGRSKMTVPVKLEAAFRVLEIRWRHRFGRHAPAPVDRRRETA